LGDQLALAARLFCRNPGHWREHRPMAASPTTILQLTSRHNQGDGQWASRRDWPCLWKSCRQDVGGPPPGARYAFDRVCTRWRGPRGRCDREPAHRFLGDTVASRGAARPAAADILRAGEQTAMTTQPNDRGVRTNLIKSFDINNHQRANYASTIDHLSIEGYLPSGLS
jgi:hypothetical protein